MSNFGGENQEFSKPIEIRRCLMFEPSSPIQFRRRGSTVCPGLSTVGKSKFQLKIVFCVVVQPIYGMECS